MKQDYNKTQRESNPTVQRKWSAQHFVSSGDEARVSPIHSTIFLNHHVILSLYLKQNIPKMQGLGLQTWVTSQACMLLLQKTQIQFLVPMGHKSQLPVAASPEGLIPFSP